MRKTKSLLALLCAVVAAFVLALPAFAAPDDLHTLTITSETGGHTFRAYQVFDGNYYLDPDAEEGDPGKLSNITWGSGIDPAQQDNLLQALKGDPTIGENFIDASNAADVADVLDNSDVFADNSKKLDIFADIVSDYLVKNGGTPSTTESQEAPYTYTINNLQDGYYLVTEDKFETGNPVEDNAYTKFMLKVLGDVTAKAKADIPHIDKNITEVNGAAVGSPGVSHKHDDAAIGDTVQFTLSSNVPAMDGYDKYYFVITDTLSKGLTYVDGSVEVKIAETTLTLNDYSVEYTAAPVGGGNSTLEIVLKNFIQYKDRTNAAIEVTYKATVNEYAVIGNAGNPNTVTLEYSNDPNFDYKGDDKPNPGEPTGISRSRPGCGAVRRR